MFELLALLFGVVFLLGFVVLSFRSGDYLGRSLPLVISLLVLFASLVPAYIYGQLYPPDSELNPFLFFPAAFIMAIGIAQVILPKMRNRPTLREWLQRVRAPQKPKPSPQLKQRSNLPAITTLSKLEAQKILGVEPKSSSLLLESAFQKRIRELADKERRVDLQDDEALAQLKRDELRYEAAFRLLKDG